MATCKYCRKFYKAKGIGAHVRACARKHLPTPVPAPPTKNDMYRAAYGGQAGAGVPPLTSLRFVARDLEAIAQDPDMGALVGCALCDCVRRLSYAIEALESGDKNAAEG